MEQQRQEEFERELANGLREMRAGSFATAWTSFESAHVLGQPSAGAHLRSHVAMLRCAWRQRDVREVVGQLVRTALAAPASLLGRYPVGNSGRARVSMFAPDPQLAATVEATLQRQVSA